jgi:deferrochelatase/peroxidase EfeB
MSLNRRRFLQGAGAGVAGTAVAGGLTVAGAHADTRQQDTGPTVASAFPFHGKHQAGIVTPLQASGSFVAFDVTATDRTGLVTLMRKLTERARALTTGGPAQSLGVGYPPADSEVLGPDIPADGLTITVSVGSSLFDKRFGLADRKPRKLVPMRNFPDDQLEAAWLHGDLLLQICANTPDAVHHALRDLTKHTREWMQPRYRIDGFHSKPRPSGTPRNLLGFKDGIVQPKPAEAPKLVWVEERSGEPAWTAGGSYQVVRLIKMLVEFWDRISIAEQEKMFGRRRDSGAPLDGSAEFDTPNYPADPKGKVIPLDSHIRMANPRTPETDSSRFLRRPYNYDRGMQSNGTMDTGLVFCCYQQDLERQFEAVQKRLDGEPLVDYITPFGGGYFFALPGVTDVTDYFGKAMLS